VSNSTKEAIIDRLYLSLKILGVQRIYEFQPGNDYDFVLRMCDNIFASLTKFAALIVKETSQ